MRLVQLGRVAVQAESLRLRRLAKRTTLRLVLAAGGAVFLIGVLIAVHVAIGLALTPSVGALWATLIVGLIDLLIGGGLLLVALYSSPGKVEREARLVREEARAQMAEAAVISVLVGPALRRVGFTLLDRVLGRGANRTSSRMRGR